MDTVPPPPLLSSKLETLGELNGDKMVTSTWECKQETQRESVEFNKMLTTPTLVLLGEHATFNLISHLENI
jgi:hypothetical protein